MLCNEKGSSQQVSPRPPLPQARAQPSLGQRSAGTREGSKGTGEAPRHPAETLGKHPPYCRGPEVPAWQPGAGLCCTTLTPACLVPILFISALPSCPNTSSLALSTVTRPHLLPAFFLFCVFAPLLSADVPTMEPNSCSSLSGRYFRVSVAQKHTHTLSIQVRGLGLCHIYTSIIRLYSSTKKEQVYDVQAYNGTIQT